MHHGTGLIRLHQQLRSPDLTNDIATLMESLNENNVYRFQKGRVLGEDTGGVNTTRPSSVYNAGAA